MSWFDSFTRRGLGFKFSFKFGGKPKDQLRELEKCVDCKVQRRYHSTMAHPFREVQ